MGLVFDAIRRGPYSVAARVLPAARNRTPMSGPMSRRTSRSTRWSSAALGGLLARSCGSPHDGSHPRSGPARRDLPPDADISSTPMAEYLRDGAAIYEQSFAIIRAEADLSAFDDDLATVVVRMIHACSQTDLPADVRATPGSSPPPGAIERQRPHPVRRVDGGRRVTRARLPADNDVRCCLSDPRVPGLAVELGTARSAAALHLWGSDLDGAVVAIGNAPTALFELLELIDAGGPRPAAVVGAPSGSSVPPSRAEALAARTDLEFLTVLGRRGARRSPPPRSTHWPPRANDDRHPVRRRARARRLRTRHRQTARLISAADVIAYHCARHGRSIARGVAVPYLRDGQIEERLMYPVTTETVDHPGGYDGAMADFYTESAARLADHLAAGRDVGAPSPRATHCSSAPYAHAQATRGPLRHGDRARCDVGVREPAPLLGSPGRGRGEPRRPAGTAPDDELVAQFANGSAIAVLKLGRTFERVRAALRAAGRLDEAWYVERATTAAQRVERVVDVDPASVPYFSMIVVPGATNNPLAPQSDAQTGGGVTVVGLGPGPADQQTRQVRAALAAATDLIG